LRRPTAICGALILRHLAGGERRIWRQSPPKPASTPPICGVHPRRLRSAETRTLLVRRTQTNCSDTAFTAAEPRVWNYLSTDLQTAALVRQLFQTVAEDISSWSVVPKRSVNPPFNCAIVILLFTYLVINLQPEM